MVWEQATLKENTNVKSEPHTTVTNLNGSDVFPPLPGAKPSLMVLVPAHLFKSIR